MSVQFNFIFILINFLVVISARDNVPVLLWSPQLEIPPVLGLREVGAAHFSQYLSNIVQTDQPIVALFIEESLSSEDFVNFGDDDKPVFSQLTQQVQQGNVEYLPSVTKPLKGIRLLKDGGYVWKNYAGKIPQMDEPTVLVFTLPTEDADRKSVLSNHDSYISEMYGKLQKAFPNVLAIYTGHTPSWKENRVNGRVRRDAKEGEDGEDEPKKDERVIRAGNIAIVASTINYIAEEGGEVTNFTTVNTVDISTNNNTDEFFTNVIASFPEGSLNFTLSANPDAWQWGLVSVVVKKAGDPDQTVMPSQPIGAPRGWSWFCNKDAVLNSEGKSFKYPRLTLENVQLQANIDMDRFEFGQPIDCVPYFSMPIWSGILIIAMLLVIMLWGILMLMDINTNDRFDDPKGKTITISATD